MCGRYYVDETVLQKITDQGLHVEGQDIHPGDRAPVLISSMDGVKLEWQSWGLPGMNKGSLVFNARCETVTEKRMFQDGIRCRRAVIPARWFYEWNRAKEKITFLKEEESVLYLAGFYNFCEDGAHFVILTTQANDSMKMTHDRMPLILEKDEVESWLRDADQTRKFLEKHPGELRKQAEYEQLSFIEF